ncbi:MAG: hypothetical protein J0G95_03730 [Rhizobiales bacterium]|nr:hypothetical protein [Hyphomicrobiales bacterium]
MTKDDDKTRAARPESRNLATKIFFGSFTFQASRAPSRQSFSHRREKLIRFSAAVFGDL